MNRQSSRLAFTVLEMVLSVTILSLMMAALFQTTNNGLAQFRASSAEGDLGMRTTRALHRIVGELLPAQLTSLVPDLEPPAAGVHTGSPEASFQAASGWSAGGVDWSATTKIAFEQDEGETDDGTDEDGDGLVDEGLLSITWDEGGPDETRVVLAHGVAEFLEGETENGLDDNGNGLVDERGLSFDVEDGVLTVRLTLARLGPRGDVLEHTEQRSLLLRNF